MKIKQFFFFFILSIWGNSLLCIELSYFLHQFQEYKTNGVPCWYGLTKDERDVIVSKLQTCNSTTNLNPIRVPNGPFKEIYQELVFELARDRLNHNNKCIKNFISFLQKRDTKGFYGYWVTMASSYIAYRIIRTGIARREYQQLLIDVDQARMKKEFRNKKTSKTGRIADSDSGGDATDSEEEFDNEELSPNEMLEEGKALYKERMEYANSRTSNIPFLIHEDLTESFIEKINERLIPYIGSDERKYPDYDKVDELKLKIKEVINDMSEKIFIQTGSVIDDQLYIDTSRNISSGEKQMLWDSEIAMGVIDDLLSDQPKLKQKLRSCIEGDYGEIASNFKTVYDGFFALFGARLFLSPAKYARSTYAINELKKTPILKSILNQPIMMNRIARHPFLFSFNTFGVHWSNKKVREAYRVCVEKTPRYGVIRPPKDCNEEEEMKNFTIDSFGLINCIEESLAVVF